MIATATVVTSVHTPDDPRIRLKTVGTLVDHGWDVTYVSQRPGPSETTGLTSIALDGTRWQRVMRATRAMFRIRSDVTIVHDPELLPSAVALGMVRGRRSVVFDLHEDVPRQLMTRPGTPRALRRLSAVLARWGLRFAERTVTITLAEPNYAWMFRDPHVVFENLPIEGSLPRRSATAAGVVYVGDITEARGALLLVEAMSGIQDERLTMIGRCGPDVESEIRSMATELGVDLVMTGFLPYAEAWQLAAEAKVGVSPLLDLPNYRHSLPTKIDEYRSVGLVPVVSDLPGSLSAIDGSDAAMSFEAGNAASLAAALGEALTSHERAEAALRESAGVRSKRTWDAGAFAEFYSRLVSEDP